MSFYKSRPIPLMEAGPERELMACFLERVKLLRMNPLSKIYPSNYLNICAFRAICGTQSVTSVTSFSKFLYNKYIHLEPNVFL